MLANEALLSVPSFILIQLMSTYHESSRHNDYKRVLVFPISEHEYITGSRHDDLQHARTLYAVMRSLG